MHRLLQTGGGLARRRGERDERVVVALLGQQRDDPRHGRGLPGSRPAGDDREAPAHGRLGGDALQVVGVEEPGKPVGERGLVHGLVAAERAQVGRDLALLPPVAVEIERGADQAQRPALGRVLADGDERARCQRGEPRLDRRPRKGGEIDGLVGLDRGGLADRREIDEDVAEPRGAHGERRGEGDRRVGLAGDRGETRGDVDVGRREHADVIECPQEPGRVAGAADVVRIVRPRVFGERVMPALLASRTSLRATTSGAGGRQANTPHGVPSTVGVSGPVIPRTNR